MRRQKLDWAAPVHRLTRRRAQFGSLPCRASQRHLFLYLTVLFNCVSRYLECNVLKSGALLAPKCQTEFTFQFPVQGLQQLIVFRSIICVVPLASSLVSLTHFSRRCAIYATSWPLASHYSRTGRKRRFLKSECHPTYERWKHEYETSKGQFADV